MHYWGHTDRELYVTMTENERDALSAGDLLRLTLSIVLTLI